MEPPPPERPLGREVGRAPLFSQAVGRERLEVEEGVVSFIRGAELCQGIGDLLVLVFIFCMMLFYGCETPRVLVLR